jgi:hypothetical protein
LIAAVLHAALVVLAAWSSHERPVSDIAINGRRSDVQGNRPPGVEGSAHVGASLWRFANRIGAPMVAAILLWYARVHRAR